MENAIKKAIAGGYKQGFNYRLDLPIIWFTKKGRTDMLACNDLFFDHLFWQALGKQQGWEDIEQKCENCEYEDGCVRQGWNHYWHAFIDHIAVGGSIDEFFDNLLINQPRQL